MRRKTTSIWGMAFHALTGSGTTVRRTRDFRGRKKTIVHNHSTGVTKEYTHGCGFWGNRADVKVRKSGAQVATGTLHQNGRHGTYEGTCYRCNGTGTFAKTGEPCRRCGGTGRYRKSF